MAVLVDAEVELFELFFELDLLSALLPEALVLPAEVLAAFFSAFAPEFLKSVSYQPVPFSLNAAAVTCFFKEGALHAGQSINFGSLIF